MGWRRTVPAKSAPGSRHRLTAVCCFVNLERVFQFWKAYRLAPFEPSSRNPSTLQDVSQVGSKGHGGMRGCFVRGVISSLLCGVVWSIVCLSLLFCHHKGHCICCGKRVRSHLCRPKAGKICPVHLYAMNRCSRQAAVPSVSDSRNLQNLDCLPNELASIP